MMTRLRKIKRVMLLAAILAAGISMAIAQTSESVHKSQEAKKAMDAGDFPTAIRLYEELLQQMPEVTGLQMNLGMAYFMNGDFARAVSCLEPVVSKEPSLSPAWQFLGTAQLELGRLDAAVESLRRYCKLVPDDPKGLEILTDAQFRSGRLEEARKTAEEMVRKRPGSPRGWYELGRIYESLAGKAFEDLDRIAPESAYWFALVADSKLSQQQFDTAFFFYRKALEANPDMRGIHIAISRIYRIKGHDDWARVEEEKEMAKGVPDCEKEPALCAFLRGESHAVIEAVGDSRTPEAFYWKSQAYNQLALAALSQLANLPPSIEVHRLRAEVNRNLGRHWDSVAELKKALQLDPNNILLKQELAISQYLNRDYDGSRALAVELLEDLPSSARLYFIVGDGYLYQQEAEKAVPYLEKAIEIDSEYVAAHSSLGRALMTLGKAEQAIPHLLKSLPLDQNGDLHYQLARAYQRAGQRDAARQTLQKYQELRRQSQAEEQELKKIVKITPP